MAELNGKDRTDLKKFRLAQSERKAVVAKIERHLLHIQLQREFDLKPPCVHTAVCEVCIALKLDKYSSKK